MTNRAAPAEGETPAESEAAAESEAPAEGEAAVRERFSSVKPDRFLTGAALKKASQTRS